MGLIAIEGMDFHAYHGYYEEERRVGGRYTVDVYVETDFEEAAKGDELEKTVNYEVIFAVVEKRMKQKTKLLETIVQDLMVELQNQFSGLHSLRVRINKHNPPLAGKVARTYVELSQDFRKNCSRCSQSFLCHANSKCWCHQYSISASKQAKLRKEYCDCLCSSCLEEIE